MRDYLWAAHDRRTVRVIITWNLYKVVLYTLLRAAGKHVLTRPCYLSD
jgi:hypothetical protein